MLLLDYDLFCSHPCTTLHEILTTFLHTSYPSHPCNTPYPRRSIYVRTKYGFAPDSGKMIPSMAGMALALSL